jgi:TniQ
MGTPLVESLTGYITRLAEAHSVSTGILYIKEIAPIAGKGNIFSFRLEGNDGYPMHTINGLSVTARDFVHAMETLTKRADLRYLTLLPWRAVLPLKASQRRVRAWCPNCLCQWRDAGQPVYEPLLWRIRVVTVCASHQQHLCHICPYCQHQIGPLNARTRPGYCSRCSGWLAPVMGDELSSRQQSPNDALAWSLWIARTVGETLAAAPGLPSPLRRENVMQSIASCINHLAGGNRSAFAQIFGVGEYAVKSWQEGKTLPQLPLILEMCYSVGTSLLDFLSGTCLFSGQKVMDRLSHRNDTPNQRMSPRSRGQRVKSAEVEKTLQAILKENPPPSVRRVTKRLNLSSHTIYRLFPVLCHAIAERFADYRKIRATVRKELAREEVKAMAYELHAKGIKITRNHMRPLLTSSDYLNLPEGRAALQEVKRELGLCTFQDPNGR